MQALYELTPDSYEKYVVPQRFLNPAKDTAKFVQQFYTKNAKLIDLGTGNGIVLSEIRKQIPDMTLLGLDNSAELLEKAQKNGADLVIKASLPEIPLIDNYLDFATSNFVLSHVPNYEKVLEEVSRVLKPKGKFIFTAWAGGQKHYNKIFYDTVIQFISPQTHTKIMRDYLPNEDFLIDRNNLTKVLKSYNLDLLDCVQKKYEVPLKLEDYLNCRLNLLISKYMQQILPKKTWDRYVMTLHQAFEKEVGTHITYEGTVDFYICECI